MGGWATHKSIMWKDTCGSASFLVSLRSAEYVHVGCKLKVPYLLIKFLGDDYELHW